MQIFNFERFCKLACTRDTDHPRASISQVYLKRSRGQWCSSDDSSRCGVQDEGGRVLLPVKWCRSWYLYSGAKCLNSLDVHSKLHLQMWRPISVWEAPNYALAKLNWRKYRRLRAYSPKIETEMVLILKFWIFYFAPCRIFPFYSKKNL